MGKTMCNILDRSIGARAAPDGADRETLLTSASAGPRSGDAEQLVRYGPPEAAIRHHPDPSAEIRRQFTSWG